MEKYKEKVIAEGGQTSGVIGFEIEGKNVGKLLDIVIQHFDRAPTANEKEKKKKFGGN